MISQFKIGLKAARVNVGLTQTEVSKELGISNHTLIKWESGVDSPKVNQFEKLCKLYRIPKDNIDLLHERR